MVVLIILICQPVYSWWGIGIPNSNDHSELTEQALESVANNDSLNEYKEISAGSLNIYDDIIESSAGLLDFRSKIFNAPSGKLGYIDST